MWVEKIPDDSSVKTFHYKHSIIILELKLICEYVLAASVLIYILVA